MENAMMATRQDEKIAFEQRFRRSPECVVYSPGRANLIGEHTDYNDGFAMPMAIDRRVYVAMAARNDRKVVLHSLEYNQDAEFELDDLGPPATGWLEYAKGVAWVLEREGHELRGFYGVVGGNVPAGAGLSSSAALELAIAKAFSISSELPWHPTPMAKLAQAAENEWVGTQCGAMDQMASAQGKAGHALLMDCRNLETHPVKMPGEVAILILDTATRRQLHDSRYNERREECERAARKLGITALRDMDLETLAAKRDALAPVEYQRARHVVSENLRTIDAAKAMEAQDAATLGRLMNESHVSLRDDFQVSTDALNTIVECAGAEDGCYGARMTGAGFGGCAIALVDAQAASAIARAVEGNYAKRMDMDAKIHVCVAADGTGVLQDEE
jgi:galactokinase